MATVDELRKSITPGSLPYGERAGLEQALSGLGPQQMPQAQAVSPTAGLGIPSNPLDPLLAGELPKGDNILSGLGPKPQDPILDSRVERLRMIALHAKSPVLRYLASRAIPGLISELNDEFS